MFRDKKNPVNYIYYLPDEPTWLKALAEYCDL